MIRRLVPAALFATTCVMATVLAAGPLRAQEAFYNEQPDRTLRFADMEFAMPIDPLLPSWVGRSHIMHTPSSDLRAASGQLRAAIPTGTDATTAAATLARAGARCAAPTDAALMCSYHDVETPRGGQYFDSVNWTVTLPLAAGHVTDILVARDWTRR